MSKFPDYPPCNPGMVQYPLQDTGTAPSPVPSVEREWLPIETAPKDGTVIIGALILDGCIWRDHEMRHNGSAFYTHAGFSLTEITHWIPLPASSPATHADLREEFAALSHEQWSRWMRYLFSRCTRNDSGGILIPRELAERWHCQVETPYAELSEAEKESNRDEADRVLSVLRTRG